MRRNLMFIVFIIGFALFGATQQPQIKLKLLGEKVIDKEAHIQMALAEGKRIKGDGEGGTIFFDKNGKVIKRLNVGMSVSRNGRYGGALYASMYFNEWTKNDSFVLYDSLGNKIWSITRGEDKGTIFHSRFGRGRPIPAHADIYISSDGSRVVGVEGFDAGNFSRNDTFRIDFYGEGGIIIREVKLPHPYYWQAGWSPDGKMFVVSCPGNYPHGISRDDIIYAYDRDGNLLWKYVAEGVHLTPVQWSHHQTLIVTNTRILHATGVGFLLLSKEGRRILLKKLEPPLSCDFRLSPNKKYAVGYDFTNAILVSLSTGEIIWKWKWITKDKIPVIEDCFFSPNTEKIAMSGISNEDKGSVFIFDILKGYKEKIEFEGSVNSFGRGLIVYFSNDSTFNVWSIPRNTSYKIKITKEER